MNRARALAALQKPKTLPLAAAATTTNIIDKPALPPASTGHETSGLGKGRASPPPQPPPPPSQSPSQSQSSVGRDKDDEVLDSFDRWDPMGEHFYASENTLELKPDEEPECVVTGQMSSQYARAGKYLVCDFYLKHGSCADGDYCSRLHIKPSARETLRQIQDSTVMKTNKTCLFFHNLLPIELQLAPGSLILVSLTCIEAPNKFRMVAPYEQMNFAGLNEDEIQFYAGRVQHSSPFKTKLEKCHEQLAMLFDHNYRVDNINDTLFLDQIVACKLDDGRFYRGALLEKLDTDVYKVALIDTGKWAILPRISIFSIRANCLNDAPLALMASLRVKPPGGRLKWPEESLSAFKQAAAASVYMLCRVLSLETEDLFTVDLLDMETRSSLTSKLIDGGLAEASFA